MQNRYFENPQVIPENTVPPPEMVGMITTIAVKVNPEREDSETRTVSFFCCFALFLFLSSVGEEKKNEIHGLFMYIFSVFGGFLL